MKKNTTKLIVALMLVTLTIITVFSIVNAMGETAKITTDKPNYAPEETVTIFGEWFGANKQISLSVTRPDGVVDTWTANSGAAGSFTTYYLLDGITGYYTVTATDGTSTASTIFKDAPPKIDLDQVRNGNVSDPTSPGDFQNGNVGSSQGHYIEGYSIPYRGVMTDMPTGKNIYLVIEYDTKHSDAHAIDYLTYFDRIDDPPHVDVFGHPPETIDPLINVTGPFTQNSTFPIPTPSNNDAHIPNQPSTSFLNLPAGERVMTLYGGTITAMGYVVQGNETDASIASTSIYVNFTLVQPTAVLAWGGHIGSRLDWGFDPDGTPHSAGGISGSPYHMRFLNWSWTEPPNVPNLGNTDRSLSAAAVFAPEEPFIFLTKTPSTTKAENGTSVTYQYNVTNVGTVDFTDMNITDNIFGVITSGQTLLVNQSKLFNFTTILTQNTTNIAIAWGTTSTGATANATATATVQVIHPAISLTKTPSSTKVENGSSVTYTYNTTNTGDTPLTVSLVDNVYGTLFTGKVMAPGESNITTIVRTLTVNTTNTATATGVDQLATQVTAQASATVTVLHPAISLTKTPSSTKVENGSSVTYTYVTTNTGDTPLTVSLVDNVYGTLFTGKVLAPGQSNTTTIVRTLTVNTTNTATATGVDQLATQVTAQASATVTVLHPDISLTKTPSSTKVENGSSVTYTYVTTNTGDTPLTVSLVDNVYGTLFTGKVLNPGQSNTTTIVRTLTVNTTNTATATGVDQLATQVTAQASATVTVLHPAISLTKTPSSTKVESGSTVTYTYVTTNTGDTPLTVSLVDNIYGTLFTGKVLAPGESNTTMIVRTITDNTTNTATATGVDQLATQVTAQASATVRALRPSLTLTKTPSSTKVENGASVTYTYNTTNTGDTSLTVNLTDNQFGTIFTGKVLAPGASNITTVVQTLTVNTTNIATATFVDQTGATAQVQATATVTVIHPAIAVTKTPSAGKALNTTAITYTYNVTNIGDTPLTVNLTDNVYGVLWTGKLLAPGQSNITTIVRTLNTTTTNTATARGVDQLGTIVQATASATVTIIHPAISITKTCAPDDQLAPGNITWTVVVRNIGDVPLTNINITETRSTIANFSFAGPLAVGGTITIIATEINLPPGTYYNNATVVAAHQLGTVSAWDDAQCVIRPVFILKQFTGVTVLPEGIPHGFNATLVNGTLVNVYGLKTGPKVYFNITYYFENSLNFLGDSFDGQAHNFTMWDKWGGNLMALGSPPTAFNQQTNVVTLADGSVFDIHPRATGTSSYRGYIGDGLDISNLASQGEAWITMHLGDQQNGTNPGKGKGNSKDGTSYDTDTVWYIGELGVNQSATLTLFISPGKNPGGQLEFTSLGCTVINTGPRVRAYGDTYDNEDFLYAVDRTNTLTVCVFPAQVV